MIEKMEKTTSLCFFYFFYVGIFCFKLLVFLLCFYSGKQCFCSSKKTGKGNRPGKAGNRFWKSIKLGFKTPKEAIEGFFIPKLSSLNFLRNTSA